MEDYKSYRKDFSRLGFRFLLGTLATYAVSLIGQIIIMYTVPELLSNVNFVLVYSMAITYLVGMPLIWLLVRKMPVTKLGEHEMGVGRFLLSAIMCFSLMYCSNWIGTIITTVIGAIKGSPVETNAASQIALDANMGLTFFFMVLCAPVVEELVFRKLIVDRTVKYGQGVAIFLSGLMFGLFHGNLSQFVYAFALGMFFAFIYIKTGKIKYTIGLHMIINFMGGIVSVLILKMLTDSGLYDMVSGDYDPVAFVDYVMSGEGSQMIAAMLVLIAYVGIILCIVIAGIVLFIAFRKKLKLERGEVVLEKGKRFRTIILNPGMVLYGIFWIVMIIYQLFAV